MKSKHKPIPDGELELSVGCISDDLLRDFEYLYQEILSELMKKYVEIHVYVKNVLDDPGNTGDKILMSKERQEGN